MAVATRTDVAVERLDVSAYEIPTDEPESDGTLEWESTTIVVVHAHAGGETGLGYAPAAAGTLVEEKLACEVDFRNLVEARAVDCLQADVTRRGGITGLLHATGLAAGYGLDVSGHCAPQLSAHAFCAVPNLRHLEYFHDHVRVESLLFDGVLEPDGAELRPDRSRAGHGLERRADAERYAA